MLLCSCCLDAMLLFDCVTTVSALYILHFTFSDLSALTAYPHSLIITLYSQRNMQSMSSGKGYVPWGARGGLFRPVTEVDYARDKDQLPLTHRLDRLREVRTSSTRQYYCSE